MKSGLELESSENVGFGSEMPLNESLECDPGGVELRVLNLSRL